MADVSRLYNYEPRRVGSTELYRIFSTKCTIETVALCGNPAEAVRLVDILNNYRFFQGLIGDRSPEQAKEILDRLGDRPLERLEEILDLLVDRPLGQIREILSTLGDRPLERLEEILDLSQAQEAEGDLRAIFSIRDPAESPASTASSSDKKVDETIPL